MGRSAGYNTTGSYNTHVGDVAGYTNTSAAKNTYVGAYAGYYGTGQNNTLVGQDAGYTITTGARNTVLGRYNGNQGGLDIRNSNNNIVLSDGDGTPLMNITDTYRTLGNPKFREYEFSGYANINSTFSVDVVFLSDASQGVFAHIEAAMTHHPSYDCALETWYSRRGTSTTRSDEQYRRDTTNAGSWSVSSPSNTILRITHNGGSYSGSGPWWVKVVLREVS